MKYHAYGLVLSSELPLPELTPAPASSLATISISVQRSAFEDAGWTWIQPRPDSGDDEGPWVAIGARDGRFRVIFDSGPDFVVSVTSGASISTYMSPHIDPARVRHRLIDQVVPLVMSHLGRFVLHASAVLLPAGAIAFVGPAGAGKSTLAASFGASGAAVLADDAVVIERERGELVAVPAYAGVRVWPDVLAGEIDAAASADGADGASKRRLGVQDGVAFAGAAARLRRVYVLRRDECCSAAIVSALPPREAIMALVAHAFVLDVADKKRVADQFARVVAASADAEVRLLTYPDELSELSRVRDVIRADAGRV